jgi:hypothetical protein
LHRITSTGNCYAAGPFFDNDESNKRAGLSGFVIEKENGSFQLAENSFDDAIAIEPVPSEEDMSSSEDTEISSEITELKKEIATLQDKLTTLEQENKKILEELSISKKGLVPQDTADLINTLKSELKAIKEKYSTYKAEAEIRLSEIKKMLEEEKLARTALERRLAGASAEKNKILREAEKIEREKRKILAKFEKVENDLKSKLNKAPERDKKTLQEEYDHQMELKRETLSKLRDRERRNQEAEAQLELDLKAELDKERIARIDAEEEIARLKKERKTGAYRGSIEDEKKKVIEGMKRESEQQKKILELANEEEKKRLKAEFKQIQMEKEEILEELKAKLAGMTNGRKVEKELKARLEVEMKKKLEDMIKEELAKSMTVTKGSPVSEKKEVIATKKTKVIKAKTEDIKPEVSADGRRGIPYDLSFENFYTETGLCSNWISDIYEDENDVWVGTRDKGVARYIKAEDNWVCYSTLDGLAGNEISSIVKYDNIIYVGTDLGISTFDGISWKSIKRYKNIVFYNTLMKVHDNILWVAARTMYGGFLTFDGQNWVNKSLMRPGEVLNKISCFDFQGDILWIGTTKNGIYRYDGREWETLNVISGLVSNFIYSIAIDGDDLWIGSCCGLVLYNSTTYDITILDKNEGLAHDSVYEIGIDGHAVWFATKSGISMYDGYEFTNYYKSEGIADERATSLLVTPDYVWFGSVGGLIRADKEY